ncbi:MAG: ATP-binding protein [Nitrospirota bacterium]
MTLVTPQSPMLRYTMRSAPTGWFRHLTIGKKFLLSFSLIVTVLICSLTAILIYLSRVNSYVDRHQRITVPAVVTAGTIQQTFFHMLEQVHHLLEHQTPAEQVATLARLEQMLSQSTTSLEVYRATHAARTHPVLLGMLTQHQRTDLADLEDQTMDDITSALTRLLEYQRIIATPRARAMPDKNLLAGTARQYESEIRALETATTTLIDVHRKIDGEMKLEGDRLVNEARLIVLGVISVLGLLIVLTYLTMRRSIAQPLRSLAATADRVAHHDLTAQFESWPNRDEVGTLATSLSSMVTNLRERTAALTHKTKELEAFTYSIAHDLKGPLREIEGFSSLLEKQFLDQHDPHVTHYIDVIRKSSLRLTHMIDSLLKYSRLEQQDLPRTRFNVLEMIDSLLVDRQSRLGGSAPQITVDLPFTDLYGEPVSIRQALVNLLDNALKFSRYSACPTINIGGRQTPTERILWVQDNGIGFDAGQKQKLFGLFERLHTAQEFEGTGVGLAIVKMVADKHRGRVWAESSPGKGSMFYLAFPEGQEAGSLQLIASGMRQA